MNDSQAAGRVDLAHEPDFQLGSVRVRPSLREVWLGGAREQLEPRVMQVLVVLARTPGSTVSRDDLIGCCWEGRIVGEDAINRVISKLRRLSEHDDGASFTIETIPRVGYRLWTPEPVAEAAGDAPAPPPPALAAARGRWPRRVAIATAAVVVLALLGTLFVIYSYRAGRPPEASLAVLPFRDLSRGGDQAYFAEGVAEEIQGVLASDAGIRVMGRTSSRKFKDAEDIGAIRKALDVTHVLEGSVGSQPGAVRINVRLLRTSDGAQVWAEQYDRRLDDIFAVQDEIGASVARRLRGTLGRVAGRPGTAQAATPAGDVRAYDLYLAARGRLRERKPELYPQAERLLEQAVAIDPDYAPAIAALAETRTLLLRQSGVSSGERLDIAVAQARGLAQRAIDLAPERAEGYAALGQVDRLDAPARAIPVLERAVKLDPSRADVRNWLAFAYVTQGRYQEALAERQAAHAVDPFWRAATLALVQDLVAFDRTAEAQAVVAHWEANAAQPAEAAEMRGALAFASGDLSEALRHYRLATQRGRDSKPAERRTFAALRLFDQAEDPADPGTAGDLLHARDAEGMLRASQAQGSGLFTVVAEALQATMLFNATGRWRTTLDLYRGRFRSPAQFCAWSKGSPETAITFGYALAKSGDRASAEAVLRCHLPTLQRWLETGYMRDFNEMEMAQAQALLGRREAALDGVERAVAAGWIGQHTTLSDMREMPAFESLFEEPRFKAARSQVLGKVARERQEALAGATPRST